MKNTIAHVATQEALTEIFKALEIVLKRDKIPHRSLARKVGAGGGLWEGMIGRHISRKVTPGCDIFLEELIQAGFEIRIEHCKHDLKWNSQILKAALSMDNISEEEDFSADTI